MALDTHPAKPSKNGLIHSDDAVQDVRFSSFPFRRSNKSHVRAGVALEACCASSFLTFIWPGAAQRETPAESGAVRLREFGNLRQRRF